MILLTINSRCKEPVSSPATNRSLSQLHSSSSSTSPHSAKEYISYFFQNATVSEMNVLICDIHLRRYSDGLSLVRILKEKHFFYTELMKVLIKSSKARQQWTDTQVHLLTHRQRIEKIYHAFCLIKFHRLLEAAALLKEEAKEPGTDGLEKNAKQSPLTRFSTSSSSSLSPGKSPTSSSEDIKSPLLQQFWCR